MNQPSKRVQKAAAKMARRFRRDPAFRSSCVSIRSPCSESPEESLYLEVEYTTRHSDKWPRRFRGFDVTISSVFPPVPIGGGQ